MADYPTVAPYVFYEDAAAAFDWLIRAFGFSERMKMEDDSGRILHAELDVPGGGVIMLGTPEDYRGPQSLGTATMGIHVYVDDVDAHFERARDAGAEILMEPTDQEYGDRRYDVKDLEGHPWYFATAGTPA